MLSVAPLVLFLLLSDWRAVAWFAGTILLLATVSFTLLDALSDGWYRYYVLELPRLRLSVSADTGRLATLWTHDLLRPLPIALVLGAAGTFAVRRYRDGWLAVGLVASAWMARLQGGAWNNAALPAYPRRGRDIHATQRCTSTSGSGIRQDALTLTSSQHERQDDDSDQDSDGPPG